MAQKIQIACPDCETRYQISNVWENKRIKCRKCGNSFLAKNKSDRLAGLDDAKKEDLISSYEKRIFSLSQKLKELQKDAPQSEEVDSQNHDIKSSQVEDITNLSDEDLKTFKFPERREMTVSYTDLRGFTNMIDTQPPEQVRTLMNAYLEEIIYAIDINSATVDKIVGDEVMAMYGAPRYFKDHALRAVKTACDQMVHLASLQKSFSKLGKVMPDCSIGINTGLMIVGNIGNSSRQDYTVLGSASHLAARLCGVAEDGEIVMTDQTLKAAIAVLPENWEMKIDYEQTDSELSQSLPKELRGKVLSIGPYISTTPEKVQFRFKYKCAIEVKGSDQLMPVVQVIDERKGKGEIFLNDEQLLTSASERVFGKYKLLEIIGKGEIGEVWKAKNQQGDLVAIKLLTSIKLADQEQIERFTKEAEKIAKFQHRGICKIYDIGEADKVLYIAMEYIDGVSLQSVMRYKSFKRRSSDPRRAGSMTGELMRLIREVKENLKPYHAGLQLIGPGKIRSSERRKYQIVPIEQTLTIINKICDGLQYIHDHGVLHRELKPANIMLRMDGEPVIMDIGLAKLNPDSEEGIDMAYSRKLAGTIEYIAPEQLISSEVIEAQADVYSIGAILYQMLSGRLHYYAGGDFEEDVEALQSHQPLPIREHNQDVDHELELITLKALQLDRRYRYRSVAALKEELQRFLYGDLITVNEINDYDILKKLLKRNKNVAVGFGIGLIVLLILILIALIVK